MEYTKGEWKTHKNALGTWTIETNHELIGQVDRHFNAHLIAQAPKFYEAAKKWMRGEISRADYMGELDDIVTKAEGK